MERGGYCTSDIGEGRGIGGGEEKGIVQRVEREGKGHCTRDGVVGRGLYKG